MADRMLRVAVVGCAHGELERMYATVRRLEESGNGKIDLLLCCGDFQAVRNEIDLNALACPPKYRSMNSFWKYYSGQATAPCTTVFIGGNHEASNYMWELFYGGWVAPNIFYLGAAGVINFGGLRIAGLSGIYKPHDYHYGHFERAPYNEQQKRSIYHVREYEVLKLLQLKEPVDIFLSHDWPRGIAHCGDTEKLLRYKDFLRQEIEENTLGSEPASKILTKLKPSYWFSAHLHVKFAALVQHPSDGKTTKFLALDKCLPSRGFIQILDIPVAAEEPLELRYDKEWLAITRAYHGEFPRRKQALIGHCGNLQGHRDWIEDLTAASLSNLVPPPFCRTAPPHEAPNSQRSRALPPVQARNPQTEELLRRLELPYLLDAVEHDQLAARASVPASANEDPNEIHLPPDGDQAWDGQDYVEKTEEKDPNQITLPDEDGSE